MSSIPHYSYMIIFYKHSTIHLTSVGQKKNISKFVKFILSRIARIKSGRIHSFYKVRIISMVPTLYGRSKLAGEERHIHLGMMNIKDYFSLKTLATMTGTRGEFSGYFAYWNYSHKVLGLDSNLFWSPSLYHLSSKIHPISSSEHLFLLLSLQP